MILSYLPIGKWRKSEAEIFKEVALQCGVPDEKIITEDQATNTGENIILSYHKLLNMNISTERVILVQTPYMERRTFATFMSQWPGDVSRTVLSVTSPDIPLLCYTNDAVGSLQHVISLLLDCMQRIKEYPERGFQIAQNIPDDVWEAHVRLTSSARFGHVDETDSPRNPTAACSTQECDCTAQLD